MSMSYDRNVDLENLYVEENVGIEDIYEKDSIDLEETSRDIEESFWFYKDLYGEN